MEDQRQLSHLRAAAAAAWRGALYVVLALGSGHVVEHLITGRDHVRIAKQAIITLRAVACVCVHRYGMWSSVSFIVVWLVTTGFLSSTPVARVQRHRPAWQTPLTPTSLGVPVSFDEGRAAVSGARRVAERRNSRAERL